MPGSICNYDKSLHKLYVYLRYLLVGVDIVYSTIVFGRVQYISRSQH